MERGLGLSVFLHQMGVILVSTSWDCSKSSLTVNRFCNLNNKTSFTVG